MSDDKLKFATQHQLSLRNHTCIYCCEPLTEDRTREHVIASKFVPKGTLDINLIAWACQKCNQIKSDLEDDLSLITMLPVTGEAHPPDDKRMPDIIRKAKSSVSRRTGKPVRDSNETMEFSGEMMPGVKVSFTMVSNPQADQDRVFRLAWAHVQAFFYLTTYDQEKRTGVLLPGDYAPVGFYRPPDWGNAQMRGFMDLTANWDPKVSFNGNEAFFRFVSRRNGTMDLWSWAVEWNRTMRVIGFYGETKLVKDAVASLPQHKWQVLRSKPDGSYTRQRTEIALPEAEDTLFVLKDDQFESAVA